MQQITAQRELTWFPAPLTAESNSLYKALDVLGMARTLDAPALKAICYLEFIYADAIEASTSAIRQLLPLAPSRTRMKGIADALGEIKRYMERFDSFPYPLNRQLDDDRLIVEAIDVLQDALDRCLDKDMHTQKVREALRFLTWKDGSRWDYVSFWNALTYKSGNGSWQNAQAALNNIRLAFGC